MTNVEISRLLEERDEIVQFRGGAVLELLDIPGQASADLQQHGWRRANFMGGLDVEAQKFYSRLTLGKPLMSLQIDPLFGRLPQEVRARADRWAEKKIVFGGDDEGAVENGSSLVPTLLARLPGLTADVDFIVCTEGTSFEDYSRENPAMAPGNERYEGQMPIASSLEVVAMGGLYHAVAEASDALLARRIS